MDYKEFLNSRASVAQKVGKEIDTVHPILFPFQADIVKWAVGLGRAAVFADCGAGKTLVQLEWARNFMGRVLIVAPIAVAQQTIREGNKIDLTVTRVFEPEECVGDTGIWITNYERVHKFKDVQFDAIVLDESSILKSIDGKTRNLLLDEFTKIPYRLCCTATPAPNDITELANHAEFLGVMSRVEMLATWFVHDESHGAGWRLKGWASDAMFKWMAQWCVFVRKPSDLGYDDGRFMLPPLSVTDETVECEWVPDGMLFAATIGGIGTRAKVRRSTMDARIERCLLILAEKGIKLADSVGMDSENGVESRIFRNPKAEIPRRSGISPDPHETINYRCGRTEGIHEGLLHQTPGQVSPTDTRATGGLQRDPATEVSGRRGVSGCCETKNEGMAGSQSISAKGAEGSAIRVDNRGVSGSFTETGRGVRDLRISGHVEQAYVSSNRPQPCDGGCAGDSLRQLQSCDWEDEGRSGVVAKSGPIPREPFIIWCGLNDEQRALARALGDLAFSIEGGHSVEQKEDYIQRWLAGERPVMISKTQIMGFGLNFQHCHNMMFLGIGDSYEQYYQAIRRCWRFGQTSPVDVRIVVSDVEGQISNNVKQKEREAQRMSEAVVNAMRESQIASVRHIETRHDEYKTADASGDGWQMKLGDCVERLREIPSASIGLSVFSPPFASLYTYSNSDRDMGNNKDYDSFFTHFGYMIPELMRVTMPGRRCCVHVQQVATRKAIDGVIGWRDFRADTVRAFVDKGWVYDGEVVIDKDPQAQAIRTKSKQLMFVQKNRDSAWLRPAMADYILLFRHPDENAEPVKPGDDVSNEDWILWARPIWYGIRESETLQASEARDDKDEKHICPLQLGTIERCIRLWSNVGDTVLSPFAGIGSEGYVALKHNRKFVGIELKPGYFNVACRNLNRALAQFDLFASNDTDIGDDADSEPEAVNE